jgi:hypothetical protein
MWQWVNEDDKESKEGHKTPKVEEILPKQKNKHKKRKISQQKAPPYDINLGKTKET